MRSALLSVAMGMVWTSLLAASAPAADWPRWRGLDGNAVVDATSLPATFDQTSGKGGDSTKLKNVKWVVRLGGCTIGSPVVADGKVYIGGAMDFRKTAVLWCFRESDGKMLWRMRSPFVEKIVNRTFGICCPPAVDGNSVYVLGQQGEVFCLDADGLNGRPPSPEDIALLTTERKYTGRELPADGRRVIDLTPGTPGVPESTDAHILWQFDMLREVNCWPLDAQTAGVLIRGDRAYIATGTTLGAYYKDAGGQFWVDPWKKKYNKTSYYSPSLIVLDKTTGKLLATDQEGIFERTFHGAHGSPILATVNGREQLIYAAGDGVVYAFDPDFGPGEDGKAGALKLVWKYNMKAPGSYEGNRLKLTEAMATPVFYNNRVYASIGNDLDGKEHPDGGGRLVCIDPTKTGDVTTSAKMWSFEKIAATGSTVAIANGLLFTGDAGGHVYCLNADTGAELWSHETRKAVWSSPVVADGKVFVMSRDELLVFAAAAEKKLLGRTALNDATAASPTVANNTLYVATDKFLYALQQGQFATLNTTLSPWTPPEHDGVIKGGKPKPKKITRYWPWGAGAVVLAGIVASFWLARRKRLAPALEGSSSAREPYSK